MGERVRQTLQSAGVRTVTAPDARIISGRTRGAERLVEPGWFALESIGKRSH